MALRKIAQRQETQKSDQPAVSQIPGGYYLDRHMVFAAQVYWPRVRGQRGIVLVTNWEGFCSPCITLSEGLRQSSR